MLPFLPNTLSVFLVNAYKLTTGQGHPPKPISTEKEFTSAVLAPQNSTINTVITKTLQNLINNWKKKRKSNYRNASITLSLPVRT